MEDKKVTKSGYHKRDLNELIVNPLVVAVKDPETGKRIRKIAQMIQKEKLKDKVELLVKETFRKGDGKVTITYLFDNPPRYRAEAVRAYILKKSQDQGWKDIVEVTIYEIAKNVFGIKKPDARNWRSILKALEAWKYVTFTFENAFYKPGEGFKYAFFRVFDDVQYKDDKGERAKRIKVLIGRTYLNLIKESLYYRMLDFKVIKALKKDTAIGLYYLLLPFAEEGKEKIVKINIYELAEKLKIAYTRKSEIIRTLIGRKKERERVYKQMRERGERFRIVTGAIGRINKNTELEVDVIFEGDTVIFKVKKLSRLDLIRKKAREEREKTREETYRRRYDAVEYILEKLSSVEPRVREDVVLKNKLLDVLEKASDDVVEKIKEFAGELVMRVNTGESFDVIKRFMHELKIIERSRLF